MTGIQRELIDALASIEVRTLLYEAVLQAVKDLPAANAATPDDLLTVEQAASLRGSSVGALRKLILRGRVPCVRVGRTVRLRRRDVLTGTP